jgi:hypothetical protein
MRSLVTGSAGRALRWQSILRLRQDVATEARTRRETPGGDPESRLWVAVAGCGSLAVQADGERRREAEHAMQVSSLSEQPGQTENG